METTADATEQDTNQQNAPSVNRAAQEAAPIVVVSKLLEEEPELYPVVEKFVRTLFVRLKKMVADFAKQDFTSLALDAHWLKGAAGTVGFHVFTEPAKRLEMSAKSRSASDIAATLKEIVKLAEAIQIDAPCNG